MVAYPTAQPTESQYVDSRPISQPSFQSTTGILAKGVGDVLDQGVDSLDKLVKEHLSDNIKAQAYAARDQLTSDLEDTDFALRNNVQVAAANKAQQAVGAPTDANGNPSLLPAKETLPSDLKGLPSQIERLGDAKANGNVNKGLLDAQMDNLAKDYRRRWPGYTDWIDKQFSDVLGGDPANQRITALIGSINSYVAANKEKADKLDTALLEEAKKGNMQAPQWSAAHAAGLVNDTQVRTFIAQSNYAKGKYEQDKATVDDINLGEDFRAKIAEKGMLAYANSEVAKDFTTMYQTVGINSATIADHIDRARRGIEDISGEQWDNLSGQVQANKETRRAALQAEFDKPLPNSQRSQTDIVGGPKKRDEIIEQSLSNYNLQLQAIKDKDLGLAHRSERLTNAIGHDTLYTMMKDPNWGPLTTTMAAGNKAGGPEGAIFLQNLVAAKNLKQPDTPSLEAIYNRIISAPDIIHGQQPRPLQQYVQQVQSEPNAVNKKGVIDSILSFPRLIAEKLVPDQAKENVANATFTPQNAGMLGKIQLDFTTPDGKPVRGRYSVFADYGSPEMVKAMKKIADTNPAMGERYKNWMETSFGVDLFGLDIAQLAKMPVNNSQVKILWNSTSMRFETELRSERTTTFLHPEGLSNPNNISDLNTARSTIERINGGIQTIARVAKEFGETDVNAYILKQLQGAGFDTNKADMKGGLLPEQMVTAIKASRKKPKEAE